MFVFFRVWPQVPQRKQKIQRGGFEKTNHCHGISIAVMNIITKINFRKEGFISSDSYSPSSRNIRAGNQGRNPGVGTDAEAMKEWCLLACSLWFVLLAILQHPRPPVHGRYYPQLVGPIHINHQTRKCTMGLSIGQLLGTFFSTSSRFPLPKWFLSCVRFVKLARLLIKFNKSG